MRCERWQNFTGKKAICEKAVATTEKTPPESRRGDDQGGRGRLLLRWMAGNASIDTDAVNNWKPSKKKSIERIDGIVALIMALDRASTQPPPEQSVYEPRGFLYV
ncbi:MAG: terminase TerL endonuclease subunit [Thermoguttaceae bacterium]